MEKMRRTATCGQLRGTDVGQRATLNGWVDKRRDHGGVIFINLRDRYGVTQCVINAEEASELLRKTISPVGREFCLALEGMVTRRPGEMVNPKMATGEVELRVERAEILSKSETPPFEISHQETEAQEALRLKYRYLDLRSHGMQQRMALRHRVTAEVRSFLWGRNFFEMETPTLICSTPEGARDFLVPSRLHPGKFFALPQSPQIYKQLLMTSGFDRYFQIARCYRDEDFRGDRQPEFTQIDIEMSFVSREDVLNLTEHLMRTAFLRGGEIRLPETPFPRLSYHQAMSTYGTDKPDTRFALTIQDFSSYVPTSGFSIFKKALEGPDGVVKVLVVPKAAESYSRKKIEELEKIAKLQGVAGLAWLKVGMEGPEKGISSFFVSQWKAISRDLSLAPGDLLLFAAGPWESAHKALGAVRSHLGKSLGLVKSGEFSFVWVTDFPLFEWDEETQRWTAVHHLFSLPKPECISMLDSDPGKVVGQLYDLVLNGYELGSGSIRPHQRAIQEKIFQTAGFSKKEAQARFGFFLEALKYGVPPHGGIALGLDRIVAIMAGREAIRDVIGFPKSIAGVSSMDGAPSSISQEQYQELHLAPVLPKNQSKKGDEPSLFPTDSAGS